MTDQEVKVGIVSCSGEDLCEGTISRLATRRVLETLRPGRTVTICLPLFLAGDEQEQRFARYFPTITVDGCAKVCARRGTESLSGPVSAAVIVPEVLGESAQLSGEKSTKSLPQGDQEAVNVVAEHIARLVDEILAASGVAAPEAGNGDTGCECGKSAPAGDVLVDGKKVSVIGLPLVFQQLREAGLEPDELSGERLLQAVRVYHGIAPSEEGEWRLALLQGYRDYCEHNTAPG